MESPVGAHTPGVPLRQRWRPWARAVVTNALIVVWLLMAVGVLAVVVTAVWLRRLADRAIASLHAAMVRAAADPSTVLGYEGYAPTARTGDLLIMQCGSHGLRGLHTVECYPTHSALVWVHPQWGVCAVECTKFSAPYLPNILPATREYVRGVRVVPLRDYLAAPECWTYVAVRRRRPDAVPLRHEDMEALASSWFPTLDFEPMIADRMDTYAFLVTAIGELVPALSRWAGTTGGLAHTVPRATSAYCSEFVTATLARLGAASLASLDDTAWRVAPVSLLSGRTLDRLARPGHAWQAEELLQWEPGVGAHTFRRGDVWGSFSVLQGLTRKAAHL